jgi:hypothetical protein
MATDIAGLFGITPQGLSQQRYQQDLRQGYELAQLDPGAAARATLQSGVGQLGRGIAGMMGVEDPQMKLISARQSIIGQLDQTDPASLLKGAQMLTQMGDQQGAFALADYARKAQESIALAQQRMRERAAADPFQQLLRTGKYTPESLAEFERTGKSQDLVLYEKPEKPEKDLRFGVDREAIAGEMYDNKPFAQLTPTEKAAVNKRVEEEQGRKAERGAAKVYTPGSPVQPKDWESFTLNVLSKDPVMQRTSTILSDAPSAIDVIRTSTENDISAAALPGSLARLVGKDSSMSNQDIQRFARTGGLDNRLAGDAVKFFTGRATDVKKDQAEKFAVALYRGALLERKKKLQDSADEFGYLESPNYKRALTNIDKQLDQFKLVKKGETTSSTTQSDDDLIKKYNPNAGK